jgi:hypothetical protein
LHEEKDLKLPPDAEPLSKNACSSAAVLWETIKKYHLHSPGYTVRKSLKKGIGSKDMLYTSLR